MSEKRAQKTREQASALVETGETVRHALPVMSGPPWALLFGVLGAAFLRVRTIALTDKALYVMTAKATGGVKEVEHKLPLGSVAVSTGKSSMPLQSTLVVGDQSWSVAKAFKDEAERLAAAASGP
jgi:hypothetical protein